MCGIVGILGHDRRVIDNVLSRSIVAMRHRGPDGSGQSIFPFGDGWLGLGHTRLAILDLSDNGKQPMTHPVTGCVITFNGEIYNCRELRDDLKRRGATFSGHSDTEVLLAGLSTYGPSFLERVEGMYAFALYDPRSSTLQLARDPSGIKPLYYRWMPDGIVFASETRTLVTGRSFTPKLSPSGVASFLAYGASQEPTTTLEGVQSLPPGTSLLIDAHTFREKIHPRPSHFWRLPELQNSAGINTSISQIRQLATQAVESHLLSDVPTGIFLSSGIDSTILAGIAAKTHPEMECFTVAFANDSAFCEGDIASRTAKSFHLKHRIIPIEIPEAERSAAEWFESMDQPSMDGLNVFIVSKAVRAQGIKVALSGLGADELFGGYPSFVDVPKLWHFMKALNWSPKTIRSYIGKLISWRMPETARSKFNDILACDGQLKSLCLLRRRCLSGLQLAELGLNHSSLGLDSNYLPPSALHDISTAATDPIFTVSQCEFRSYQQNVLLRDADINSMAFGLEVRVPFLDRKLVELALSLPSQIKLPNGQATKPLLRMAFKDLLRSEVLEQSKRGFVLPMGRWMCGPLRERCEAAIAATRSIDFLNSAAIDKLWGDFLRAPETPIWSRALSLVALGEYFQRLQTNT